MLSTDRQKDNLDRLAMAVEDDDGDGLSPVSVTGMSLWQWIPKAVTQAPNQSHCPGQDPMAGTKQIIKRIVWQIQGPKQQSNGRLCSNSFPTHNHNNYVSW